MNQPGPVGKIGIFKKYKVMFVVFGIALSMLSVVKIYNPYQRRRRLDENEEIANAVYLRRLAEAQSAR